MTLPKLKPRTVRQTPSVPLLMRTHLISTPELSSSPTYTILLLHNNITRYPFHLGAKHWTIRQSHGSLFTAVRAMGSDETSVPTQSGSSYLAASCGWTKIALDRVLLKNNLCPRLVETCRSTPSRAEHSQYIPGILFPDYQEYKTFVSTL